MILVDTSVLIPFLKGGQTIETKLLAELEERMVPYFVPFVCAQEVLQGARNEREWQLLEETLATQNLVGFENQESSHFEAARMFYDCRRKGHTIRSSTDCLIAQLALELKMPLLHDDRDFLKISKVRPLIFPRFRD